MIKFFLVIFLSLLLIIPLFIYTVNFPGQKMNENLLNKVNAVENQWINYDGTVEQDNNMIQSQFVPYNSNESYKVNNDTYVSYYKGEDFITTELHGAESELAIVEEADGVILSFNKENKNGIKLVTTD